MTIWRGMPSRRRSCVCMSIVTAMMDGNFMVWFFTIVRNVCLNMRRNKKSTVPFETSLANRTPADDQGCGHCTNRSPWP